MQLLFERFVLKGLFWFLVIAFLLFDVLLSYWKYLNVGLLAKKNIFKISMLYSSMSSVAPRSPVRSLIVLAVSTPKLCMSTT